MKRRVVIRIENGKDVSISIGGCNSQGGWSEEALEHVLGKQPNKYTVVYSLAPKTGKFEVRGGVYIRVGLLGDEMYDWQVCQLPRGWAGKRCNRKVIKVGE